ncbi:MAG TPA: tRNA (adenosine(37)-N6)-dimethylallyltransferase MiaA [Planctomycetaceae bacterium]|nr:tRNA (adenosine(37)-N6)-dimethylallyltransferase MiaA [Planctomycetaceae bacterium]
MRNHNFDECWFLSGPTASGKTHVAIELARRIGAEIVSMDSMALYRKMDIGTAKPSADERREVPHHLVDVIDPHEEYSLAQYVEAAARAADEIRSRSRQVLFVGGTPLYLKSLLRGIFEGPPADWELRRRLRDEAVAGDPMRLHRRLAQVDPTAAERLHPNDTRRIIRALEVFEKTGQPISRLQQQFDHARPADESRVFVLDWPRGELHDRIDRRVEQMFTTGLVDEVRLLLASPKPPSRTAAQALGYREVMELLQRGGSLGATVDSVKTHTRQFAKRQETWFRSLSECRFVPMSEPFDAVDLAVEIERVGAVV